MLKNYFTIAVRNILKRKFFAGINLLGMTAGITVCLLIALYVINEFSYDRFHANADRIYQVGMYKKFGVYDVRSASTCPPLADAMLSEIPEVESVLRRLALASRYFVMEKKLLSKTKCYSRKATFLISSPSNFSRAIAKPL